MQGAKFAFKDRFKPAFLAFEKTTFLTFLHAMDVFTNTMLCGEWLCVWVDVDATISILYLQHESSSKIYKLDEVDVNSLNEYIQVINNTYICVARRVYFACMVWVVCPMCRLERSRHQFPTTMELSQWKDMQDVQDFVTYFGGSFVNLCGYIVHRFFCRACGSLVVVTFRHIWLALKHDIPRGELCIPCKNWHACKKGH